MNDLQLENFVSKWIFSPTGCWQWIASVDKNGYGWFGSKKAHRISYEIYRGIIPKGMLVCHSCDNPSCVNPEHLWIGTNLDNMRDRNQKGRHKLCGIKGSKHHKSKLNQKIVKEIKDKLKYPHKQADLAKQYGVTHQTISNIKRGLVWVYVD